MKVMCLVLAVFFIITISAFADNYKVLPVSEDFSSLSLSSVNIYNWSRGNTSAPAYDGTVPGRLSLFGRDNNDSMRFLRGTTAAGFGGKKIEDKSFHLKSTQDYTATATLFADVRFGSQDSSDVNDATYFTTPLVFEFSYFSKGNDNYLCLNLYGNKADGSSANSMQPLIVRSDTLNFFSTGTSYTFEKGRWYNIAIQYYPVPVENIPAGRGYIYVNGELKGYNSVAASNVIAQATRARLDFRSGSVSTANPYDEDGFQLVLDDFKVYEGLYNTTNVKAAVTANQGSGIIVDDIEKVIEVPAGMTAGEVIEGLTEQTGGSIRVYSSIDEIAVCVDSTTEPEDMAFSNDVLLSSDNVLVAENAAENCYEYYTIEVSGGLSVRQGGLSLNDTFTLNEDLVAALSETLDADASEEMSRVLLAGLYDGNGKLLKVVADSVDIEPGNTETLRVTIEKGVFSSITDNATIKIFIWEDMIDIKPVLGVTTLSY
jgi:hypothetical protein